MTQFKIEVGDGRSGDTLTIEAEDGAAAVVKAEAQIADKPWVVEAVYELTGVVSPTATKGTDALTGDDLPDDGPEFDPDQPIVVDTGEGTPG